MGRAAAERPGCTMRPHPERVAELKRTTINLENSEGLPLSDAVRFGDLLFVSGMVGMDAAGNGERRDRRRDPQTFRNIAAVLAAGGASLATCSRSMSS